MRTLKMFTLFLCLFILCLFSGPTQAAETFDMELPEIVPPASSEGFVNSFQDSSSQPSSYNTSGRTSPAISEEPEGSYSSAFTSLSSRRSEEDVAKDSNEKWHRSQDEQTESVDLETLPSREPTTISDNPVPSQSMDLGKEIDSLSSSAPSSSFVDSGTPVSGKQRRDLILRTISQNYPELKNCYQDGLKKDSNMKGKVVMGWAMDPQGRVSAVEVQTSQLKNKQVEKCMVDRLSGWRFPHQAKAHGSKDRMTYTFQFIPERDEY